MSSAIDPQKVAEVVADLKAGVSQREAAKRHGIGRYRVQQAAYAAGLATSDGQPRKTKQRRRHPCAHCERRTQATDRVCQTCRAAELGIDTYSNALIGGRWVPRRSILVWVEDGAA